LQATALVHEAYLRLTGGVRDQWQDRAHFFRASAEAMRCILIENARKKSRWKRGGRLERMALASHEARAAYLLGACGQDRDLRRSVDELLAAFNEAREMDILKEGGCGQKAQTVVLDARLDEGPGTVIGRYKLLQQIGEGGMGVVYMAEQEEPVRRRVALKIIKLGMDTRQTALTVKGHVGTVNGIAFSRDGNFMASCGADATVRLWPAATLEETDASTYTKNPP
jgi:hypothetical protein